MLETSLERVKLLKDGISEKKIEDLYIYYNNIKILRRPVFSKNIEICECE